MSLLDQYKSISTGHSSTVTISLHIDSVTIPVLQSSKQAIKLDKPYPALQGDAVLEVTVDGRSHQRPIRVLDSGPWPNWISIVDR